MQRIPTNAAPRKTILVVDDSPLWASLVQAVLGSDCQIIQCLSGAAAVPAYAQCLPDWVWMDISMPGGTGFAAARALLAMWPEARILFVTQHDENEFRREAASVGAVGYVLKDNLAAAVELMRPAPAPGPKPNAAGPAGPAGWLTTLMRSFFQPTAALATALGLALLTASCGKRPPAPDPEIVARVGDTAITRAQVLRAWERRQRGTAPLAPTTMLADLVDEAAGYAQAQRSGFLDKPETQIALRQWVTSRYREETYRDLAAAPEPSERELREAYAERTNSFVRPPALNLAVILHEVPRTATAEKRAEARQIVVGWRASILAATNASRAFGQTASAHSDDSATRYRRGETGWLSHAELGARLAPEVVAAAATQESGALSEPLAGPKGFYLVQVLGRRGAEVRPFAEVEPTLRHQLREARRLTSETQLRVALRTGLDIRTNLDVLSALTLTNRPAPLPATMRKG